jgi:hypothetical protein
MVWGADVDEIGVQGETCHQAGGPLRPTSLVSMMDLPFGGISNGNDWPKRRDRNKPAGVLTGAYEIGAG